MILNQIDSGKPCPDAVSSVRRAIPDGSLMCFVQVQALQLAKVLDRLEALEVLEASTLEICTWLLHVVRNPKVIKRSRERGT